MLHGLNSGEADPICPAYLDMSADTRKSLLYDTHV